MDAGAKTLEDLFGQRQRFVVPLYQRPYVWTREDQWEPLWDDIRSVADRLVAKQGRTRTSSARSSSTNCRSPPGTWRTAW